MYKTFDDFLKLYNFYIATFLFKGNRYNGKDAVVHVFGEEKVA